MRVLNANLATQTDADRHNINKFLNRLLGLPVQTQNALFECRRASRLPSGALEPPHPNLLGPSHRYYTSVFKWVVVTAKAGRLEPPLPIPSDEW